MSASIVATPDAIDAFIPSLKLIVAAVPTREDSCRITIPLPDATIPVKPEPSPTNCVAVTIPVALIPLK